MAIKFDYNQTINQAKQLEELSREMSAQCVKKLDSVCGNIEAAWTGDAAKTYLKYMKAIQTDMQSKAKYLQQVAEFLRNAAGKIKAAEEQAKSAASGI